MRNVDQALIEPVAVERLATGAPHDAGRPLRRQPFAGFPHGIFPRRQPLTRTYNRFAPLLRLYIDLASGIPIASQFGSKWLRVQISDFPALSARPRIGISKPTEDNGMSAGEVKQYLVEHAKSHGVLSFRGNRARRVQTLLPALATDMQGLPRHCPFRADVRSRCAPARCAGARAERPAAGREDSDGEVARSTRSAHLSACNA